MIAVGKGVCSDEKVHVGGQYYLGRIGERYIVTRLYISRKAVSLYEEGTLWVSYEHAVFVDQDHWRSIEDFHELK